MTAWAVTPHLTDAIGSGGCPYFEALVLFSWVVVRRRAVESQCVRGASCRFVFRPGNTTEESALVEELIQTIAERQGHGRRGRAGGQFPAAPGSRPGGPGAAQEGRVALLALRAQVPQIRRRGRRTAMAPPGLRPLWGSSPWAWRRAWRARSMAWRSPKCRERSRAAGSPGISRWSARG